MIAIAFGLEAVNIYTLEKWEDTLEIFQGTFALTIVVIGVPATIYAAITHFRMRKNAPDQIELIEAGFVQSMFNNIAVRSFSFIFVLSLFLLEAGSAIIPDQPMEFYFNVLISATTLFFSLSFWYEMLKSDADEMDGE